MEAIPQSLLAQKQITHVGSNPWVHFVTNRTPRPLEWVFEHFSVNQTSLTLSDCSHINGRKRAVKKPGCEECDRLWQSYSEAVFDYVKIDGQRKMAQLRHEVEAVGDLTKKVQWALARRDLALERFREHETTHPILATAK